MELVKGVPLTRYCDEQRLTPRQRLELFIPVCQAIQHAHQKGIIHRDIKPSNVLVALYDGKPVPKVIDFGIAKATGQQLTEKTLVTGFGTVVGTLEYMSPEQAELNQLDIDTRSDVYSLGVLLYELVTGTTPLERKRLKEVAMLEVLRLIREEEPQRPSTRLSTTEELPAVAANRGLEPKKLTGLVRGELDWIVMKCLEKDRNRRYETANGLALDLQCYLADEPVQACPPSASYRFRKFARRNKRALATIGLLGGTLVAAVVALTVGLIVVNEKEKQMRQALSAELQARAAEAKRRQQTRAALDAMTSLFIEDLLAKQPSLTVDQKNFLTDALHAYEEFAADTGQDEASRYGAAQAYHRVALIRSRLSPSPDAVIAFQEAMKGYAQLAADFPNSWQYRRDLAVSQMNLGSMLRRIGRLPEALLHYDKALAGFRQLAESSTDLEAQRLMATNVLNLAILLRQVGQISAAETATFEALAVRKRIAVELPNQARPRYDLALSYLALGEVLSDAGKASEAETARRDAVALLDKLVADFATVPEYRRNLARGQNALARSLFGSGQFREAETPLRDSCVQYKRLAAQFPTVADHRYDLASSLNNLAYLLQKTARSESAETSFREALALLTQLEAEFPTVEGYRRHLVETALNLADILVQAGRYPEAESVFQMAIPRGKALISEFPGVSAHEALMANALLALGRLRRLQKQPVSARELLEQAKPHYLAALKHKPRHPQYRSHFGLNCLELLRVLLDLGDYRAAVVIAEELVRVGARPPKDSFEAACGLARCVPLVEKDDAVPGEKRKQLAQAYAERAVKLLHLAVKNGFKDLKDLTTINELAPLRARTDFQQLLAELQAKHNK
jgi:tetratricopeptide (TPR) repeat protein